MEVKIEKGFMTIKIAMNKPPKPSTSGKTLIIAGTGGAMKTDAEVDGKQVTVNLSAYIKP